MGSRSWNTVQSHSPSCNYTRYLGQFRSKFKVRTFKQKRLKSFLSIQELNMNLQQSRNTRSKFKVIAVQYFTSR